MALIRNRKEAQGEDITEADVDGLADALRDSTHRYEAQNIAREHLKRVWPREVEKQGRAKWSEFPQLELFSKDLRAAGCSSYVVKQNGQDVTRCLYEMTDAQMLHAQKTVEDQRGALSDRVNHIVAFRRAMRKLGVPPHIAPSDFLKKKARGGPS